MTRRCLPVAVVIAFLLAAVASAQPPASDADRKQALELYDQHRMAEARPLLEKLAAERPDDMVVHERLGMCLAALAGGIKDPDERKQTVLKARAALLRAKALGDDSNLLQTLLGSLPEDGVLSDFSTRREVDDLMKAAEAEFAKGNLDRACEGYVKAFELDPTLYQAPLFAGDTRYKQKRYDEAGEWFARAIRIGPNVETAYRYWGDALMAAGQMADARTKFIEAMVAEPYNRSARMGLSQWADRNKVQFSVVQLKRLGSVTGDGKQTTLTVDASALGKDDDGVMTASLAYVGARATWQQEKFKQEFPAEPAYRHTLKEETAALGAVADTVAERLAESKKKGGKAKLDPELAELVRIRDAGLLEAYVLLFRADAGIARDYDPYRAANREKLARFMDEFVVPQVATKR
jgi:tetratricopeptide (TPR) repeat protein